MTRILEDDLNNLEPYKHDEEMNNYCTPENKIKINQLIGKYFFFVKL